MTYFGRCAAFDGTCTGHDLSDLIQDAFDQNATTTTKFAFDLGARFNLGIVKFGVAGIALNQPEFPVADLAGSPGTVPLPRQVRGGVAVDILSFLTLAADGDFIKSDTLAPGTKSQQMSLGAEVKIPLFAFRGGATYDFAVRKSDLGLLARARIRDPDRLGGHRRHLGPDRRIQLQESGPRGARRSGERQGALLAGRSRPAPMFEIFARDPRSSARRGRLAHQPRRDRDALLHARRNARAR